MKRVGVKVDGVMLLTLLAIGGGAYVYLNRKKLLQKVNPASDQNFIYQSDVVQGAVNTPDERGYTAGDKFFAHVDKLLPFWGNDDYADQVLGIESPLPLDEAVAELKRQREAGENSWLFL